MYISVSSLMLLIIIKRQKEKKNNSSLNYSLNDIYCENTLKKHKYIHKTII